MEMDIGLIISWIAALMATVEVILLGIKWIYKYPRITNKHLSYGCAVIGVTLLTRCIFEGTIFNYIIAIVWFLNACLYFKISQKKQISNAL
jgi:hypothetical protein